MSTHVTIAFYVVRTSVCSYDTAQLQDNECTRFTRENLALLAGDLRVHTLLLAASMRSLVFRLASRQFA